MPTDQEYDPGDSTPRTPTDPTPHPDSLLGPTDRANGYADLMASLALSYPDVLAAAAEGLEADAGQLRVTSPAAFLARAWIARMNPDSAHGLHVQQARRAADACLGGELGELLRRDASGVVFHYVAAKTEPEPIPARVRVRPDGRGNASVELIDDTGATRSVASPPLSPPVFTRG